MKILKWIWDALKKAWSFTKKNWRWLIPVLILVAFGFVPEKTFNEWLGFFAGIALMGFIWYAYSQLKNQNNENI
jgi:hypothetical protein